MRFKYCPDCGSQLSPRDLGDDHDVPWCDHCGKPWFDMFSSCVICLVHDGRGNVLILRQNYISTQYGNLVSGYIVPGETAEDCARREILEETGLTVTELSPVGTFWFGRKGLMMLGYIAGVAPDVLRLSPEVDSASWHPAAESVRMVHPEGSTSYALCRYFLDHYGK